MVKLKVLIEGYAHPLPNGTYQASPTTSLIYSDDKKVLVDPGTNSKLLIEALSKEGITDLNQIDIIFLSHYHPDHFLNLKLFPNHDLYDGTTLWKEDIEKVYSDKIPGTDIQIIPTPGHSPEHCSLLIIEEKLGKVVIAQDVFWWEDGKQKTDSVEELMTLEDPFASDVKSLRDSRKKVLELGTWIVPGHGKIFKNPKTV